MTTPRARSDAADRLARVTGALAVAWGSVLLARGREVWVAVDGRRPALVTGGVAAATALLSATAGRRR